jgi:hypothetical protein
MGSPSRIDRVKHEADVVEHVMKGIHAEPANAGARGDVLNYGVQGWLGGLIVSAVHVKVLDDSDEGPPDRARGSRSRRK